MLLPFISFKFCSMNVFVSRIRHQVYAQYLISIQKEEQRRRDRKFIPVRSSICLILFWLHTCWMRIVIIVVIVARSTFRCTISDLIVFNSFVFSTTYYYVGYFLLNFIILPFYIKVQHSNSNNKNKKLLLIRYAWKEKYFFVLKRIITTIPIK